MNPPPTGPTSRHANASPRARANPPSRRGIGWPLLITIGLCMCLTPFVIAAMIVLGT